MRNRDRGSKEIERLKYRLAFPKNTTKTVRRSHKQASEKWCAVPVFFRPYAKQQKGLKIYMTQVCDETMSQMS